MIEVIATRDLGEAGLEMARDTIRWIETCLHLPGGKPFILFDWERDWILRVFREHEVTLRDTLSGKEWTEVRRAVSTCLITIARKNGKSQLIAAIAAAFCFGPLWVRGTDIVCAATKFDQAKIVFDETVRLMKGSAVVAADGTFEFLKKSLFSETHMVSFKPVASQEAGAHGLNCNVILIDEIARLPNMKIYDTLKEATSTRENSMVIAFSTMDERDTNPMTDLIGNMQSREHAGLTTDGWDLTMHSADLEEDPDPFSDANLLRANPSAPYIPTLMEKLQNEREDAKVSDVALGRWMTTRLNIAGMGENRFIDPLKWKACIHPDGRSHLDSFPVEEQVSIGVDLSKSRDLTAIGLWFPERQFLDAMCFLPAGQVAIMEKRHNLPFMKWVEAGHLIACEGNVVDAMVVAEYLGKIVERFTVTRARYDAWSIQNLKDALEMQGVPLEGEDVRMGSFTMNDYLIKFENLVNSGELQHSNSPILNYCIGNIAAVPVPNSVTDLRRPKKAYHNSLIDAGIAGMLAVGKSLKDKLPTMDEIIFGSE